MLFFTFFDIMTRLDSSSTAYSKNETSSRNSKRKRMVLWVIDIVESQLDIHIDITMYWAGPVFL
jgi:hypothetical protein